jgi:CHAT domain-containing protein
VLPNARTFSGTKKSFIGFVPIPQTVCELCAIASELGTSESEIDQIVHLGTRMTKEEIMKLAKPSTIDGRSDLQNYRIVHFATHGIMSAEVPGINEAGLILSPPRDPKDVKVDDGILSAGEIASLKLDADWVVLSACNTAASRERGGEAFSGLARAFLYAGARSVLVSHWSVSTNAAVKITTSALAALAGDRTMTRAQALRKAISQILKEGQEELAAGRDSVKLHPSFWGPFALIGEI